jgi:ABC-2 type transport system permease protein
MIAMARRRAEVRTRSTECRASLEDAFVTLVENVDRESGAGGGMSGALRRLKAIMLKEARQIVRDPSSILIGFILPIFLTLLSGYSTNLDIDHVPIGLVLEDGAPAAQDLAAAFLATSYFDTRVGYDRREFTDDLVAGRLRGISIIPRPSPGTSPGPIRAPPIQVIADGSEPITAHSPRTPARASG